MLKEQGYSVWFDHYDMGRDIDNSITQAIDNCKVFIVCLTTAYCLKINNAVKLNKLNDNCFKEWNYAVYRNKIIIPVIMEEEVLYNYIHDKGIINMYLNSLIYFAITTDNYEVNDFKLLCKNLRKQGVYTNLEKEILNIRHTLSFNSFLEYINENLIKQRFKKEKQTMKIKPRNIIYI
tara:strand:+ start:2299 stop:2832 length:534 start_codon:yes stop_codon:yes gene_type:complete